MLTRPQAIGAIFFCLAAFAVSLTFDLHGAVAVVVAILLFAFLAALMASSPTIASRIAKIVGWFFLAGGALSLYSDASNKVFGATLFVCGLLLAIKPLSSWLVRNPDQTPADK